MQGCFRYMAQGGGGGPGVRPHRRRRRRPVQRRHLQGCRRSTKGLHLPDASTCRRGAAVSPARSSRTCTISTATTTPCRPCGPPAAITGGSGIPAIRDELIDRQRQPTARLLARPHLHPLRHRDGLHHPAGAQQLSADLAEVTFHEAGGASQGRALVLGLRRAAPYFFFPRLPANCELHFSRRGRSPRRRSVPSFLFSSGKAIMRLTPPHSLSATVRVLLLAVSAFIVFALTAFVTPASLLWLKSHAAAIVGILLLSVGATLMVWLGTLLLHRRRESLTFLHDDREAVAQWLQRELQQLGYEAGETARRPDHVQTALDRLSYRRRRPDDGAARYSGSLRAEGVHRDSAQTLEGIASSRQRATDDSGNARPPGPTSAAARRD